MSQPLEAVHSRQIQPENSFAADEGVQSGVYKGEQVRTVNPSVSLQDAAEEMTFGASETRETEDKKLTDRAAPQKRRSAMQIQKILKFFQEFNQGSMSRLLKKLRALQALDAASVNTSVREEFKDATLRHAVLCLARETLQKEETCAPELCAALDACLEQMERDEGPSIHAGYNIAGISVPEFAAGDAEKRQIYRDTVLHFENYAATLISLSDRYGEENMSGALQFLTTSLGADMNSLMPSSPPEALKEVMDGLEIARTLNTFHLEACRLLGRMEKAFGSQSLTAGKIMEPILSLKDQNLITDTNIRERMPFLESFNARQDASFTQGMLSLAHELPHSVFPSQEIRQQLLDALQHRLDAAVQREDGVTP